MTHKTASTKRHHVNKQVRTERRRAKRKLYLGLRKDSRAGYKMGKMR